MENIKNSKEECSVELGKLISISRKSKATTPKQIANKFKVEVDIIKCLESGEEVTTLTPFYVRLILKKYINYLGIGSIYIDELIDAAYVSEGENLAKTISIDPNTFNFKKDLSKTNRNKRFVSFLRIIFFFGLLLCVMGGLIYALRSNISNSLTNTKQDSSLLDNVVLEPLEIIEPVALNKIEFKEVNNDIYTYVITSLDDPEQYELKIEFNDLCYIAIYETTTAKFVGDQKVYKKGEELIETIDEFEDITINIGASDSVKIFINGEDLNVSQHDIKGKNCIQIKNEAK